MALGQVNVPGDAGMDAVEAKQAAQAAKAAKAAKAATSSTEAGRVGDRPYARGRAYKADRYDETK